MTSDDPVRAAATSDPNVEGEPELCAQCGTDPPANGTYWCSGSCMELWTSAHTAGAGAWPTPGYTETSHAGTKTVAAEPDIASWLGPVTAPQH